MLNKKSKYNKQVVNYIDELNNNNILTLSFKNIKDNANINVNIKAKANNKDSIPSLSKVTNPFKLIIYYKVKDPKLLKLKIGLSL
jgi:hypothetical protein